MPSAEQIVERFSVAHAPEAQGRRTTWSCIDERLALLNGLVVVRNMPTHRFDGSPSAKYRNGQQLTLLDRRNAHPAELHYRQTAGGAVGVGQDLNIALRMARATNARGDLSLADAAALRHNAAGEQYDLPRLSLPPAYVLGSLAAKAGRDDGVDILLHKGCAAENAADTISWGIATNQGPNGEDLFEAIRYSTNDPQGFSRGRFDLIRDMYGEAIEQGMIAALSVSQLALDQGVVLGEGNNEQAVFPVARAELAPVEHVGLYHLMDWRGDVALDLEQALAATKFDGDGRLAPDGEPWMAYRTSMGDMDQLAGIGCDLFPGIDPRDFTDAAFVRNAATSLFLPRQVSESVPVQLQPVLAGV